MKEKYLQEKAKDPTAYISSNDALFDLEDAYNVIESLYLGESDHGEYSRHMKIDSPPDIINYSNLTAKKSKKSNNLILKPLQFLDS